MALTVSDLLSVLRVREESRHIFAGDSLFDGVRRIYGGQMLAQSIMAMGRTVREAHGLHSMQGYFVHPGDVSKRIRFDVQLVRDGRSFSTRRVTVTQNEHVVFIGAASFQAAEGDHERLARMPDVPSPEHMPAEAEFYARESHLLERRRSHVSTIMTLFERRSELWRPWLDPGVMAPANGLWCRLREPCGDDPLLCHAVLAYACDLDLMTTAMRPRGHGTMDRRARSASLDHAMWFHAPVRPDAWFYYDMSGPCATNNRGLGAGALYQDGRRIGTAMQEGLMRVNEDGSLA
ncbi:acyl-CoA thioesterase [Paraburkholderia youngii]|uniref:Acyl-CoA thioesterase II n=1 Tax=Paraburkholderia youngii TaxID=2782701 RepID=A0A7Y6K1M0_9BURK|nr:acyl-CoA thioesterase domain-containing protein [Paraburkholderia youngii]NUY01498.1 acyl-CoA thioesterase II [Paraburkholderia youngii]